MRKLLTLVFISVLTLGLAQQSNTDLSIAQGLAEEEEFSTLVSLLVSTGLDQELTAGEFTVFAPDNGAFEELSEEALVQLNDNPELLRQVLLNHVTEGVYGINDLQDAGDDVAFTSLAGEPLEFSLEVGGLTVNNADIDSTNVELAYANGIVHAVGDIVVPMSLLEAYEADGVFDLTLVAVPADTDTADTDMTEGDLVTVLAADERFSTLVSAVQAAGLEDALMGETAYTIFAPTDEAFAALPEDELNALLADPDALARLLNYHVVDGEIMSTDLTAGEVDSLGGSPLVVDLSNGVMVDEAQVTEADIAATNGVIHAIDTVLIPADME